MHWSIKCCFLYLCQNHVEVLETMSMCIKCHLLVTYDCFLVRIMTGIIHGKIKIFVILNFGLILLFSLSVRTKTSGCVGEVLSQLHLHPKLGSCKFSHINYFIELSWSTLMVGYFQACFLSSSVIINSYFFPSNIVCCEIITDFNHSKLFWLGCLSIASLAGLLLWYFFIMHSIQFPPFLAMFVCHLWISLIVNTDGNHFWTST